MEFTDHSKPHDIPLAPGDSTANDPLKFFDDLKLIEDERRFVYYDSKQARFGVDLGPLGNAEYVNLMLPPRWYGDWEISEGDEDEELPELPEIELVGGFDTSNITGLGSKEDEANSTTAEDTGYPEPVNQTSTLPQEVNQTRGRRLVTWDELWEEFVAGTYTLPNNTEEGTASGGIFDKSTHFEPSSVTIDGTAEDDATAGSQNISETVEGRPDTSEEEYEERPPTLKPQSRIAKADYFCFEDFVNWMIERRKASTTTRSAANAEAARNATTRATLDNTTDNLFDQSNEARRVESTRPLTILASRGRCSFESKARLAMLLNDLFANSGRTNRIDHLIIYNNGTDTDNNTMNEEKLIDMSRVTQVICSGKPGPVNAVVGDKIKVGLLYVATKSGVDLMRKIKGREDETNVSPYLDVSTLFPVDNVDHRRKQKIFGREREWPDEMENDGLIKDHDTHATIGQDDDEGGFTTLKSPMAGASPPR